MKIIVPLILLLTSWSLTAATQPNIVIMLADDLGAGDLSCYGSLENKTPHLDQLAKDGLQFSDFYAPARCSPSRAALQTGRFSVRAGVYSWVATSQKMHLRVETTIAELLKAVGYATAHIGKWHLGMGLLMTFLAPTLEIMATTIGWQRATTPSLPTTTQIILSATARHLERSRVTPVHRCR